MFSISLEMRDRTKTLDTKHESYNDAAATCKHLYHGAYHPDAIWRVTHEPTGARWRAVPSSQSTTVYMAVDSPVPGSLTV